MFGAVLIQMAVVHELKDKLPPTVVSLVLSYWDAPHLDPVLQQIKLCSPQRNRIGWDNGFWNPDDGKWVRVWETFYLPVKPGWIRHGAMQANRMVSSLALSPWSRSDQGKVVCQQSKVMKATPAFRLYSAIHDVEPDDEKGISVLPIRTRSRVIR